MKKTYLFMAFACCALVLAAPGVFANVWIDEGFEDDMAFAPVGVGDGALDEGIDLYHDAAWFPYNPAAPLNAVLTHTGSISDQRAFFGTHSYQLDAGESIAVVEPYSATGSGSFNYMQFAVNIDGVPAAGTMASYNWTCIIEDVTHTWTIDFVSDGSKVDLIASETFQGLGTPTTIGTLNGGPTEWLYLTVLTEMNFGETDARNGLGPLDQGIHIFVGSDTPAFQIAGPPDFPNTKVVDRSSRDWSLVVNDGTLYVDEWYWECGFDDQNAPFATDVTQENIRPLNFAGLPFNAVPAADVGKWNLYK
jgi:hypothetical protein